MQLNLDKVRANVAGAETEDLLDRATVYREGMEPEALDLIDAELRRRGVQLDEIEAHEAKRRANMLVASDGLPVKCSRCRRPAVVEVWGWYLFWKLVPLFPYRVAYCEEHQPEATD
jgi:hypothetical protein